jgi:hypothetical protein
MPNLKFGLANLLMQPGALLKNGTGGGAPALIETAPYVMANLLVDDRYTLWKSSALSTTPVNVDFDLGSTQAINAAGMLGFRPIINGGPFVDVYYQTGAYTPGGAWTFLASLSGITLNIRDDGVEFGSVNARSVRFQITPSANGTVFTLGKFFVGALSDTGAKHSPGATYTPMGNRTETPLVGGAVVLTELGDDGAEFRIPWNVAAPSIEGIFLTFQTLPGSRLMLWPDGHFFEVYLKGRQLTQTRNFQNDYDLVLGRMP